MVAYTLPAYCQAIEVKPLQVFERREPRSGENETRTYCAGDEDTLLTSTVAGSVPYTPWVARQTYEARVAEYAIGLLHRGRYQKGYADLKDRPHCLFPQSAPLAHRRLRRRGTKLEAVTASGTRCRTYSGL